MQPRLLASAARILAMVSFGAVAQDQQDHQQHHPDAVGPTADNCGTEKSVSCNLIYINHSPSSGCDV